MGATTEGIHSPTRPSSTHRRVTPVVITAMTRCETPQMPLHHVKCFGDLTVLTTNTLTARGMAGQRQSTRSGPERGMEVRDAFKIFKKIVQVANHQCLLVSPYANLTTDMYSAIHLLSCMV
jgi:hypothetical protein